jgi:hypothetical protein
MSQVNIPIYVACHSTRRGPAQMGIRVRPVGWARDAHPTRKFSRDKVPVEVYMPLQARGRSNSPHPERQDIKRYTPRWTYFEEDGRCRDCRRSVDGGRRDSYCIYWLFSVGYAHQHAVHPAVDCMVVCIGKLSLERNGVSDFSRCRLNDAEARPILASPEGIA